MVNGDIFLGSGASITKVPELDLYCKITTGSAGSNKSVFTLDTDFTNNFALVNNLYVGCIIRRHNSSDILQTIHRITANTETTISITPSVPTLASDDYFVIDSYGAPCPAPKDSTTGSVLGTPTITTAGTQIEADESVIGNAAITGVSGLTSTSAEIVLTLSAESSTVAFAAESGTNYDSDLLTINLASPSGTNGITTLDVLFNTVGASTPSSTSNDSVVVAVADSATGEEIAQSVLTALSGKDVSVSRSGATLTITNKTGGYVGAAMIAKTGLADSTITMGSVQGGIITGVSLTNAGSSVSGSGNLTITSNGGTDGVLALVAETTTTGKRLLADTWLGITESITFPTTEVEMKQTNLSLGGSRNFTYQYKGIETAGAADLSLVANHGAWLYYFLGRCTNVDIGNIDTSDVFSESAPSGTPPTNDFTAESANAVYIDYNSISETGPIFQRSVRENSVNVMTPPVNISIDDKANLDKVGAFSLTSGKLQNAIKYTFAEQEQDLLPSFALEQVMSKLPSSNTYRTQTADDNEELNFVKIARGCRVNTLTLTANENEEVKMSLSANTRNVHSLEKTESYDARRATINETSFFNFTSIDELREPFFFSDGVFKCFGHAFLKINTLTLTMNNSLQDRRFFGVGSKSIQEAIPAQRTYEISFTGHVTDDRLYNELLNQSEDTGNTIELTFTKSTGEKIDLNFQNYYLSANNFPIADDKGPIVVEATVMPRTCSLCEVTTHWMLQG